MTTIPNLATRAFKRTGFLKSGLTALALLGGLGASGALLAEGSADLIKRGKGFRAALLASDPALGLAPPDGRQSVSLHFAYLNEGEVLNLSSSAQGVGQGQIIYRDPTGMSNRCDPSVGLLSDLSIEQAGPAAGTPCSVRVEPGMSGVWEIEFTPPSNTLVDPAAYQPISGREPWQPQQPSDFWVRAWDVSVSSDSLEDGGRLLSGRVFVRSFAAIVGQDALKGAPWHAIWFGRSSDGFIYALDTNGLQAAAFNLVGTSRGLKDADGDSLYAAVDRAALGQDAFIADPFAITAREGEQVLKLYYGRPDQGQPERSISALMGEEWLTTPMRSPQTMTGLRYDADTGKVQVTIEGDAGPNALELFAAEATDAAAPALVSVTNLETGNSSFELPEGIGGAVLGRFTAKQAEVHFPLADIPGNPNGLRLRRMNGSKTDAGNLSWNFAEGTGRFDGQAVMTTNSLRGPAGAWETGEGLGRVHDLWSMDPVRSEQPLGLPVNETDLRLALELLSIEPTAQAGTQTAKVAVSLLNGGEQDTRDIRLDLAEATAFDVVSAEGLTFDGSGFDIAAIGAGDSVLAVLDLEVRSSEQPFAMAITAHALVDSDPANDLGFIMFPEPVAVEAAIEPEPEPKQEPEPAPEPEPAQESLPLASTAAPSNRTMVVTPNAVTPANTLSQTEFVPALDNSETVAAPALVEEPVEVQDVALQFKTDLIALRKRPDSDQAEADIVFALSNAGTVPVTDLSLLVPLRQSLGDAFVGLIGAPILEVPPSQPASLLVLDPGFTGKIGADQLIIQGGSLFPRDTALVRMTIHYDPDALGGETPLGVHGELLAQAAGEALVLRSDDDFNGGTTDVDGDGDPQNDRTALPGMRLVKSERLFPGPTERNGYASAYDAVFEYTLENTGGLTLEDIALADFFLENDAVKAVIDVTIQSLEADSATFTATKLPGSFVGLDTVQRFEGGVARLEPGETLSVLAQVVFAYDTNKMDQDILSRAAAFAQVDLDGDGQLDTVLVDPADMGRTSGVDANGDGEEGNDVMPLSIGRLAVSTVLDGGIAASTIGSDDSLILNAETTLHNTGVAPLKRVSADLPLPAEMQDAFVMVLSPPSVTSSPQEDFIATPRQGYDGLRGTRVIDGIDTLAAGEQVTFAVTLELDPKRLDPTTLTALQASASAELDRDQDGLGDITVQAEQALTEVAEGNGLSVIESLIAFQAPAAPPVEETTQVAEPAKTNAPLSKDAFTPASDGEALAAAEPLPQIAQSVSSFVPAEDGQALDDLVTTESEDFTTFEFDPAPGASPVTPQQATATDDVGDLDSFEEVLNWDAAPAIDPIDQFQQQSQSHRAAEAEAQALAQGQKNAQPSLFTPPVQQQRFVRTTKVVKKLVPGPKITFPAGSVPVTVTTGFQLAVPQGYQAFQAPDGSFFLMRRR